MIIFPPQDVQVGDTTMQHDDDFYAGLLAALAVVALHDKESIFHEIVATVDAAALVDFAKRDEALEWSGLVRYGYSGPGMETPTGARDRPRRSIR